MIDLIRPVLDWLQAHPGVIWLIASSSLVLFLISLILVPWFLIRIPADYFIRDHQAHPGIWKGHPVAKRLWWWMRNFLGGLLVMAGVLMLVLPGQGLLTLFVGFIVMDFKGKRSLEKQVLALRFIHRPINRLRAKAGKSPLQLEGHGPP